MELTPGLVESVETVCRENLDREFGNTMVFEPTHARQRSADDGSVIEVTITCAEVQEIPVETKGAAAMAGAVEQSSEPGMDNRIEDSFITEDELPGVLTGKGKVRWIPDLGTVSHGQLCSLLSRVN